jgi:hypothetical protein
MSIPKDQRSIKRNPKDTHAYLAHRKLLKLQRAERRRVAAEQKQSG